MFRHNVLALIGALLAVIACTQRQQTFDHLDAENAEWIRLGKIVYDRQCAACHGAKLEGQPNWKTLGPDGKLPAPPHDESGHTWHHPDRYLIHVVKDGFTLGVDKPDGYLSNMPAFGKMLSDREIVAVLSYIKSKWPPDYQEWQENANKPLQNSSGKPK